MARITAKIGNKGWSISILAVLLGQLVRVSIPGAELLARITAELVIHLRSINHFRSLWLKVRQYLHKDVSTTATTWGLEEKGARCGGLATIAGVMVTMPMIALSLANIVAEAAARAAAKEGNKLWMAPLPPTSCRSCPAQSNPPTP